MTATDYPEFRAALDRSLDNLVRQQASYDDALTRAHTARDAAEAAERDALAAFLAAGEARRQAQADLDEVLEVTDLLGVPTGVGVVEPLGEDSEADEDLEAEEALEWQVACDGAEDGTDDPSPREALGRAIAAVERARENFCRAAAIWVSMGRPASDAAEDVLRAAEDELFRRRAEVEERARQVEEAERHIRLAGLCSSTGDDFSAPGPDEAGRRFGFPSPESDDDFSRPWGRLAA